MPIALIFGPATSLGALEDSSSLAAISFEVHPKKRQNGNVFI